MNIFRKKEKLKAFNEIISFLERVTRLAELNIEKSQERKVKNAIDSIIEGLLKLYKLYKDNPDKYNVLVEDSNLLSKYKISLENPKNYSGDDNKDTKEMDDEYWENQFVQLNVDSKRLIFIDKFVGSLRYLWIKGHDYRNKEITRFLIEKLVDLLKIFEMDNKDEKFGNRILELMKAINYEGMKDIKKYRDPSLFTSLIDWYIEIVFYGRSEDSTDNPTINFKSIENYDKYLIYSIRLIINKGALEIYKSFIGYMVDGGFRYFHSQYNYDSLYRLGSDSESRIRVEKIRLLIVESENNLEKWKDDLKSILNNGEENIQERDIIKKELLRRKIFDFKHNNLKAIIYLAGVYCLYKNKKDFINYLWSYKQPEDSDAIWTGSDINPNNITELLLIYFIFIKRDMLRQFTEDHDGIEKYNSYYFLLYFICITAKQKTKDIIIESNSESFEHIINDVWILRNIETTFEGFKKTVVNAEFIEFVEKYNLKQIYEEKEIVKQIDEIATKAKTKISNLEQGRPTDPEKEEEFKLKVIEEFNKTVSMRKIYKKYGKYEEKLNLSSKDKKRFGMNIVDDKAAFFKEWYVHYIAWGEEYGRDLALSENKHVIMLLSERCKTLDAARLNDTLTQMGNKSIIICVNVSPYRYFEKEKKYIPEYLDLNRAQESGYADINGFDGWLVVSGIYIPIFKEYSNSAINRIMILNNEKMGKIVQYSPANDDDKQYIYNKEKILLIKLETISDDEELIKSYIENPPSWLKEEGDEEKQKAYLRKKKLVQIFERFMLEDLNDFEGYKIDIVAEPLELI